MVMQQRFELLDASGRLVRLITADFNGAQIIGKSPPMNPPNVDFEKVVKKSLIFPFICISWLSLPPFEFQYLCNTCFGDWQKIEQTLQGEWARSRRILVKFFFIF